MKLDSRILEGKRPLTCIDVEQAREFVGKECIFSDKYENFENLDKYLFVNSDYSAILSIDDTPKCGDYVFRNAKNAAHYGLILPLEWVKEPEKKYIPFSLSEWTDRFAIGDTIIMRQSNCTSSGHPYTTYHYMYEGFCYDSDETWGDSNTGYIMLGGEKYAFDQLLQEYEFLWRGTWQPFGMVKEK